MDKSHRIAGLLLLITVIPGAVSAEDNIELRTTIIKGNKELPKILYIVPWQEVERTRQKERKLVLHSLFGNLFEPVVPDPYRR